MSLSSWNSLLPFGEAGCLDRRSCSLLGVWVGWGFKLSYFHLVLVFHAQNYKSKMAVVEY